MLVFLIFRIFHTCSLKKSKILKIQEFLLLLSNYVLWFSKPEYLFLICNFKNLSTCSLQAISSYKKHCKVYFKIVLFLKFPVILYHFCFLICWFCTASVSYFQEASTVISYFFKCFFANCLIYLVTHIECFLVTKITHMEDLGMHKRYINKWFSLLIFIGFTVSFQKAFLSSIS